MYTKSELEITHEALQSYRQALSEGDTAGGFTKHLLLTKAKYRTEQLDLDFERTLFEMKAKERYGP